MVSTNALVEMALATIATFVAFFAIGGFLRGAMLGDSTCMKVLVFFAVVALAGALTGAHFASVGVARHNQSATQR